MEKDLLEVERMHLSNILKECDPKQALEVEEQFAIVYTYDAVGMEGKNRVPFEDVKRCLHTKALLEYSERERKEILNHVKAFEYVSREAKENKPFDEEKLKDVHEILMDGIFQGGIYRNVNVQIFGASHQPPDYIKVYDRMSKFFQSLPEFKGNPLEKAVYAHASIAKIHPFLDGNGRLARLVLNYFLIKENYLPISIPVDMRLTYFGYLETFKVEKDIQSLLDFIKELLIKRYEEVIKKLEVSA
ncbi:MAG: Fic family protein [Acholeplasmataceae bacterium]|nr:Fic family protein [Acholeplasmataceae bacterium]